MTSFSYYPGPTALRLHNDSSFIKGIAGPPGGGKSVTCVMDMVFTAMRQEADRNQLRRTRFLIVRGSYPKLLTTTKKTVDEWLPVEFGALKQTAPMMGMYRWPMPDGTRVEMELIMLALETEEDVEKLKSFEVTKGFLNEATEVSPAVLRIMAQRVGRFPAVKDGVACTESGVLVDFNLPDASHWLHAKFEERESEPEIELPDGTLFKPTLAFFKQPPAVFCTNFEAAEEGTERPRYRLNPDAENLENLRADYYANQIANLTWAENKSFLQMIWTAFSRGKLVYAGEFKRSAHVSSVRTAPVKGAPVHIGIDTSGFSPAAVFGQMQAGTLVVLDVCAGDDMPFLTFVEEVLLPLIAERYRGVDLVAICDPSNPRDARTGVTPVQTLRSKMIRAESASTNKFALRRAAVVKLLNKRDGIVIDMACRPLISGFEEGYVFKKLRGMTTGGGQIYSSEPEKNEASHYHDALQYLCLPFARVMEEGTGGRGVVRVRRRKVM